jgi:hypothetical protein
MRSNRDRGKGRRAQETFQRIVARAFVVGMPMLAFPVHWVARDVAATAMRRWQRE